MVQVVVVMVVEKEVIGGRCASECGGNEDRGGG